MSYGNATQPGSSHRGDQLELFAKKELRPAWRTRRKSRRTWRNRRPWDSDLDRTGTAIRQGACAAEEIYCESGIIGLYFLDFSLNRTTIHLKIEKIWPRFSTFSLRSLLPRKLLNLGTVLRGVRSPFQRTMPDGSTKKCFLVSLFIMGIASTV